jgi:KDO2-lipid IV(A) lauroyltransferase
MSHVASPCAARPRPRRGGARAAWKGVKDAIGRFWLEHLMMWSLEHCAWLTRWSKGFFLFFAWRCSPRLREMTLFNTGVILGPSSSAQQRRRLAKAIIANCYDFIEGFGRTRNWDASRLLDQIESIEGIEHFHAARAFGRGVIVVTAHLGAFEIGMAALRNIEPRVHVVFQRDQMLPIFERLRARQRARLGVIEAPIDDGPRCWLGVRDALLANEVVLLQGDRISHGQKSVPVPFLETSLDFPTGPVRLALLTGAPLLPVFAVREPGGRVRIVVEEPVMPCEGNVDDGEIEQVTSTLAALIGAYIRQYPEQYHGVHSQWLRQADRGGSPS